MSKGYEPHVGDIVNIEFVVTGVRDFSKITARCGAHIQIHDMPASDERVHFVSRAPEIFEVGDLVSLKYDRKDVGCNLGY